MCLSLSVYDVLGRAGLKTQLLMESCLRSHRCCATARLLVFSLNLLLLPPPPNYHAFVRFVQNKPRHFRDTVYTVRYAEAVQRLVLFWTLPPPPQKN